MTLIPLFTTKATVIEACGSLALQCAKFCQNRRINADRHRNEESVKIKKIIKGGLRTVGFDLVRYPALARQIQNLILDRGINLVLDVGAFHGTFCRMMRKDVRYSGHICSFEPCAASFSELSNAMKNDRRWSGYRIALSDKDAEATLNVYREGDFNSLLPLRNEHALAYEIENEPALERIQLRKLDSIWNEITKSVVTPKVLLKIDTQGHDPKVVLGAVEHLKFVSVILAELPAIEIYEHMLSMADSLKLFKSLGYTPVGFYPVNSPPSYEGAVPEFEVLFIRHRLIENATLTAKVGAAAAC